MFPIYNVSNVCFESTYNPVRGPGDRKVSPCIPRKILNCHQHHVLKALLSKMYIFRVQSLYFNLSSGLPSKVLGHLSSFFSEIKNWTPETSILTRVGSTPIFSPPEGTRRESPRDKQVPESSDSDKYFILYFFGGVSTDLSHRNCCNIYYAYR